jgi:formylglycine-generating enzyme required for sulfatase activity
MLDSARRRAHEAVRREPDDVDAWVDLARAVRQGGEAPTELDPGDFDRLRAVLAQEPSARDLAGLVAAALGVEVVAPPYPGARWEGTGAASEDDSGPYDAATGMPLAVHLAALEMDFVWVPPGRYPLGFTNPELTSTPSLKARTVELPVGFYIGVTPVTQAQFLRLTGEDPSFRKGPTRPAERVGHGQADAAAAAAEARRGGAAVGWTLCIPDGNRWEIALRAEGGPRRASTAEGWFQENAGGVTHPVGELRPGPHGTVDQFGNVSEWCTDRDQTMGPARPDGGPTPFEMRMSRGGDWAERKNFWTTSRGVFHIVTHPYDRPRASLGMRLLLGAAQGTVPP